MKRKINFDRDGLTLVGDLFTPEDFDESGHYKAVIVEGSFTSVKEQMPGTYAQKFTDQGFVVLAFDYGHYGESAGEPRQLESPAEKLRDLEAAVSCLTGLPYVQAVYSELRGEKELVWADGTHFEYYDSQAQIDNAVANVTRFFRTHLAKELAA